MNTANKSDAYFDYKAWTYVLSLIALFTPLTLFAQPPSGAPMGQQMMNQQNMREYMEEYGYGRNRGYPGWMNGRMGGGYGPMMGGGMMGGGYGPMMGGMMGGGFGPMMGGMMGGFYDLDLSKEQRQKARAILHSMRQKNIALMTKMMDSRDKLADLYDTAKPDPVKIGKVYDEIFKLKREMIQHHLEVHNKIYDLLTKDQRKEMDENRPYGFGHMGGGMMMHK